MIAEALDVVVMNDTIEKVFFMLSAIEKEMRLCGLIIAGQAEKNLWRKQSLHVREPPCATVRT